jgi:hypothetical protein
MQLLVYENPLRYRGPYFIVAAITPIIRMERLDIYQETQETPRQIRTMSWTIFLPHRGICSSEAPRGAPGDVSISKYNRKLRLRHATGWGERLSSAGD